MVAVRRNVSVSGLSAYMGSIITHQNRREYEAKQKEFFLEKYAADQEARRNKIIVQEGKTTEEINGELEKYNNSQPDEEHVQKMAVSFAKHQSNKEAKHYRKYMKGDTQFTYKGQVYPVMTEAFINSTNEIKEIVKVEDNNGERESGAEAIVAEATSEVTA